ncbi:hypothetical protein BDY21DRAFT_423177 [Lineolata rhizophorae]|uniref:Uncharacterized protein n=1 Tax=Lineolata rhizophorae TaxID=578093 RepID=A0A6A6NTC3_9PEZI|nr:hypothetical protein BDY21DRAFT_423177 [Lineolata rhizophorae]
MPCIGHHRFTQANIRALQNDAHPIFKRTGFEGVDDRQYAALLPVLRLASLLLTARPLLPFWWTVFFGKRKIDRSRYWAGLGGNYIAEVELRIQLSDKEAQVVLNLLDKVANRIKFKIGSLNGECLGYTIVESSIRPNDVWMGCGATITLNASEIAAYFEGVQANNTKFVVFGTQLALTLVHEVAHACGFAFAELENSDLRVSVEPIVGNQRVAELGFAWETYVFGGPFMLAHHRQDELRDIADLMQDNYICAVVKHTWDGMKTVLTAADDWPPRRYDEPEVCLHWTVPKAFLESLWSPRFWTETVPQQGRLAFRPEYPVGWVWENPKHTRGDRSVHVNGYRLFGDPNDMPPIPPGYKVSRNGLVVKRRPA